MTPKFIIETVAKHSGCTVEELKSKDRHRRLADLRHIAIWLILKNTRLTLKEVGELFERDHSTILHAKKKVLYLKDNGLCDTVNEIESALRDEGKTGLFTAPIL